MKCRILLALTFVFLCSCAPARKDWHRDFDSSRAWEHLRRQVELGPRPPGSPELRKAADLIEAELKGCGLSTSRDEFKVSGTPRGEIAFCNVIGTTGSWPPKRDVILLGSHYDTKWLPEIKFAGANDAGSSTGCLLELARILARADSKHDYAFVFFDGEEAFRDYTEKDGLYGSRHLTSTMKEDGSLKHVKAMVLLDMIGDKDLKVTVPAGDAALTKALFAAAESLGYRDRFGLLGLRLTDDHDPFFREGVPAIALIDFSYGPGHGYWHTEADSLEHVSKDSLEIVGRSVLKMLEDLERGR